MQLRSFAVKLEFVGKYETFLLEVRQDNSLGSRLFDYWCVLSMTPPAQRTLHTDFSIAFLTSLINMKVFARSFPRLNIVSRCTLF